MDLVKGEGKKGSQRLENDLHHVILLVDQGLDLLKRG